MAIYSLNISSARNPVAALSYIASMRVRDELTGTTYFGYGRRERVVELDGRGARCRTVLPEGAPDEYMDPGVLFNAAMAAERGRGVSGKKIMVALPRELDAAGRIEAVERFVRENLTANGYAATFAMHEDAEGVNPHAHILVANRRIDPATGAWEKTKTRKAYVLDAQGQRIPIIDPATGEQKTDKRGRRQWKRETVAENPLSTKAMLLSMRESWADVCNELLPEGVSIDHRSLEEQGLDRVPTIHEGYAAREIEKRGGEADRSGINRDIMATNRQTAENDEEIEWLRDKGMTLRRVLRRLADRAASAFDRMLGRVRLSGDVSRELGRMIDEDGVRLDIPASAKPGDPVSWRVLDSVDGWQTLPARLIREGLRTVGSVLHAINGARDEWRTQQPERPAYETAAALSIELQDARGAEGRAYNDLVDAKDELASTGHLNPLRRRAATRLVRQAQAEYDAARNRVDDLSRRLELAETTENGQAATAPERSYSLASETAKARETSRQREEARRAEREREWDPSDPSDPMNLAMGGDTGLGYGL